VKVMFGDMCTWVGAMTYLTEMFLVVGPAICGTIP
jgi:hypothetical protein